MDKATALRVFDCLEEVRYEFSAPNQIGSTEHTLYNVRLDAGTSTTDDDRFYRLFVRVDGKAPGKQKTNALGDVVEHAFEYGLTAVVENGGVELS